MAEVVGVVASAIALVQLAEGVTKGIYKLKSLWNDVKEFPHFVHGLLDEIQVLEVILVDVQQEFEHDTLPTGFWNDTPMRRSLQHCTDALKTLADIVDEIQGKIDSAKSGLKRKIASARIASQKAAIKNSHDSLHRAVDLLKVAMLSHSWARGRHLDTKVSLLVESQKVVVSTKALPQHGLAPQLSGLTLTETQQGKVVEEDGDVEIPKGPPATTKPLGLGRQKLPPWKQPVSSSSYEFTWFGGFSVKTSTTKSQTRVSIQPPRWLAWRNWEFESRRCMTGWQRTIRSINVRPRSSTAAFTYAGKGMLGDLLFLFATSQASLYDRDEYNMSLLHHAAIGNQEEVCQKLLEMGLDDCLDEGRDVLGIDTYMPNLNILAYCTLEGGLVDEEYQKKRVSMMRLFTQYRSSEEIDMTQIIDGLIFYDSTPLLFRPFLQHFCPSYYTMPDKERFWIARRASWEDTGNFPARFWLFLNQESTVTSEDIKSSTREGISLIHTAAIAFGNRFTTMGDNTTVAFRELMSELIRNASSEDLHAIESVEGLGPYALSSWTGTPLSSFLHRVPLENLRIFKGQCQFALRVWLGILRDCGCDLVAYGRKEKELLRLRKSTSRNPPNSKLSSQQTQLIKLRDFEFGPTQRDWKLLWEESIEIASLASPNAGERPQSQMPGGWPD